MPVTGSSSTGSSPAPLLFFFPGAGDHGLQRLHGRRPARSSGWRRGSDNSAPVVTHSSGSHGSSGSQHPAASGTSSRAGGHPHERLERERRLRWRSGGTAPVVDRARSGAGGAGGGGEGGDHEGGAATMTERPRTAPARPRPGDLELDRRSSRCCSLCSPTSSRLAASRRRPARFWCGKVIKRRVVTTFVPTPGRNGHQQRRQVDRLNLLPRTTPR